MALPVVDSENRLVGIVTVDDAIDVLVEETTEDVAISKMDLLGHSFYVYKDIDRGSNICVVYKRTEGNCGLIIIK